jgi:hypothetical protein
MLLFGFLIGAVLPFPFYFIAKKYPKSILGQVHVVVALYGALAWNPYNTLVNYWPGLALAYVFQVSPRFVALSLLSPHLTSLFFAPVPGLH